MEAINNTHDKAFHNKPFVKTGDRVEVNWNGSVYVGDVKDHKIGPGGEFFLVGSIWFHKTDITNYGKILKRDEVKPKKKNNSYAYGLNKRTKVYRRDGFKCLACGSDRSLSLDHIVPKAKGGGNEIENLQTLCRFCNSRKGDQIRDYRTKT